jgi:hypothetical protein
VGRDGTRGGGPPVNVDLDEVLSHDELRRLRAVLEHRRDALLSLLSPAMEILWASASGAAALFQRADGDFEGKPATGFVHPEDRDAYEHAVAGALTGVTTRWEGRARSADGSWVVMRCIFWMAQRSGALVNVSVPIVTDQGGEAPHRI